MDSFRGFLRQGEVTSEIGVGADILVGVGVDKPEPYLNPDPRKSLTLTPMTMLARWLNGGVLRRSW